MRKCTTAKTNPHVICLQQCESHFMLHHLGILNKLIQELMAFNDLIHLALKRQQEFMD